MLYILLSYINYCGMQENNNRFYILFGHTIMVMCHTSVGILHKNINSNKPQYNIIIQKKGSAVELSSEIDRFATCDVHSTKQKSTALTTPSRFATVVHQPCHSLPDRAS